MGAQLFHRLGEATTTPKRILVTVGTLTGNVEQLAGLSPCRLLNANPKRNKKSIPSCTGSRTSVHTWGFTALHQLCWCWSAGELEMSDSYIWKIIWDACHRSKLSVLYHNIISNYTGIILIINLLFNDIILALRPLKTTWPLLYMDTYFYYP